MAPSERHLRHRIDGPRNRCWIDYVNHDDAKAVLENMLGMAAWKPGKATSRIPNDSIAATRNNLKHASNGAAK